MTSYLRPTVYKRARAREKGLMKYRHQYHAGNFADVHKHVLLLEVLAALTRKDKGLLFVDTHAGRGAVRAASRRCAASGGVAGRASRSCSPPAPRHAALDALPRAASRRACTAAASNYRGSPLLALRAAARRRIAPCSSRRNATKPAAAQVARRAPRARAWRAAMVSRACARCCRRRSGAAACSSIRRTRNARITRACTTRSPTRCSAFESAVLVLWLPVKLRADFDVWLAALRARAGRARAGIAAVGASHRFARRAQRLGAGGGQSALSSRGRHARMAAGAARHCSAATAGSGCEVADC